jgi:hypothetical protein
MRRFRQTMFLTTCLSVLCLATAGAQTALAQSTNNPTAKSTLSVPERVSCGQHTTFHQSVPAVETTTAADAAAQDLVQTIVAQVGMTANFRVRSASFGNVAATLCQDQNPPVRYILYDPRLVTGVTPETANYWTVMLALAHEIGHHVNTHALESDDRARSELEADFFAGFVLSRLGAPQDDASASASKLAAFQAGTSGQSSGGPQPEQRLAEIQRGWREGLAAGGAGKAQAPGLSPNIAAANARLNVQADTYVEGEGYHAITSSSVPICREACTRDKRCAMYEFHRPTRTPSGPSGDAEVGIKSQQGTKVTPPARDAVKAAAAPAPAQTWRVAMRPDVYVAGEGYRVLRGTAPSVCQQACLADDRCAMYEFYKPNQSCGLFDHTRIAGESNQAQVGLKVRQSKLTR